MALSFESAPSNQNAPVTATHDSMPSETALTDIQKIDIAKMCAEVICHKENIDIPHDRIESRYQQAAIILGIKEAYIYRDWQAAIGDFMLEEIDGGLRRFTVMGYGDFEAHYLQAYKTNELTRKRRWFNRLQAIVYDLNMNSDENFDARREQLSKLLEGCKVLKIALEERIKKLDYLTSNH